MVVIGQSSCIRAQSGCIRASIKLIGQDGCMVDFGQKWLYSGKSCSSRGTRLNSCIWGKWLYSGKVVLLG